MKSIHIATYQDAAKPLAEALPKYKYPVVIRLGGNKAYDDYKIQINSQSAINNSINKLRQKELLLNGRCKTLPVLQRPSYPCVLKGVVRSCGTYVIVVDSKEELTKAIEKLENCRGYYIEPLFHSTSEYRLHCTKEEVFFYVKKIRKGGHENDIVVTSKNHTNVRDFLKPRLWKEIQVECLKAINVLDLDIACFDIMYSSADSSRHDFYIAEANSNPELLKNTFEAYRVALDKLIRQKIGAVPDIFNELKALRPSATDLLNIIKDLPEETIQNFLKSLK